MNEYNIKVDFTKGRIVTNLKRLVQNDYNSTKINFTFDKEGRVLFKMLYPDGSEYIDEVQNNELIFGKGILYQEGTYEYEISLYSEDGRLTDYATKSFEVRSELVDTDEVVAPDDRVPILDTLINEVNTIKQDVVDGKYNGENGTDGITPNISVGTTTTLEADAEAQVTQTGTIENPVFNFAIPRGERGETGGVSLEEVKAITGELENLPTEDKSNIVNSIIELASNSGGIPTITEDTTITEYGIYQYYTENQLGVKITVAGNWDHGGTYSLYGSGVFIYVKGNLAIRNPILIVLTSDGTFGRIRVINNGSERQIDFNSIMLTNKNDVYVTVEHKYNTLPTSSVVPTKDTHFVNKKYVDDAITSTITTVLEGEY